jgi:predicted Zn-dependent peptidase
VPNYDRPLQQVGGSNNAFTSNDITNYYITLPAENLETAFWLESDRMLSLSFDPKVLEVQRKVVIEEFKERYLDQPYGDVWMRLRPLAYQVHPYRWATIGKEISHIEDATLDDVKHFFFKHYRPNHAIMVVAGHTSVAEVQRLAEKWFGPIPAGEAYIRRLPQEPAQTEARHLEVEADVPSDALYKAYAMCGKTSPDYYATDLLSDVLGRGNSSRLYWELVKERKLFSNISAYVMGSHDPGLLVVSGRVSKGVSLEEADRAVEEVVAGLRDEAIGEEELQKVKNQAEATLVFSEMEVLNRAMALATAALLGDPDDVNREGDLIQAVTPAHIHRMAESVLRPSNCSTLYYRSKQPA